MVMCNRHDKVSHLEVVDIKTISFGVDPEFGRSWLKGHTWYVGQAIIMQLVQLIVSLPMI